MIEEPPVPCPFLPLPDRRFTASDIQAMGRDRSSEFYHVALHYAQTLWLEGFPAKSLLLINRALSCFLPGHSLSHPVQPYLAVAWILQNSPAGVFIGNPRRHYQHLATRMVEPHKTLRTWRAWACWSLSCIALDEANYPSDLKQIIEEGVVEPRFSDIKEKLAELSPADDVAAWLDARDWLCKQRPQAMRPVCGLVDFKILIADEADMISGLAAQIWPAVYASLISQAQIQYMLKTMYPPSLIREQIKSGNITYAVILHEGCVAGYLGWERTQEESSVFIHKLYILPEYHGRGIGAKALQWIENQASTSGLKTLRLRVNKNNATAIRAYMREGYAIESQLITDIGQGFVMDDHQMRKDIL